MIGSWLPTALYWLGATISRTWGAQAPDPADVYRSWGLDGLAEEVSETRTDLGLAAFGLGPDGLDNRDHGRGPAGVRKPVADAPEHPAEEGHGRKQQSNMEEGGAGDERRVLNGLGGEVLAEVGVTDEKDEVGKGPQGLRPSCDEARPEHAVEPSESFETHGGIVAAP